MPKKPLVSIVDAVKEALSQPPPYPTKKTGSLGITQTVFPREVQIDKPSFFIDHESNLMFASRALALGITTDELHRQLCWIFISS